MRRIDNSSSVGAFVVVSDGLDTGAPEVLGEALASIRRRARRLVWLNPLAGRPGYAPPLPARAAAPGGDRVSDFRIAVDGGVDAWLLASPITRDVGPHRMSWEADLIEDPGPMPGVVPFHADDEEDPKGCACDTPGTHHPWPFAALALLALRRRR